MREELEQPRGPCTQVNLKEKACDELFKMLDTNDDGTVSKFEFATGFEKFRER